MVFNGSRYDLWLEQPTVASRLFTVGKGRGKRWSSQVLATLFNNRWSPKVLVTFFYIYTVLDCIKTPQFSERKKLVFSPSLSSIFLILSHNSQKGRDLKFFSHSIFYLQTNIVLGTTEGPFKIKTGS